MAVGFLFPLYVLVCSAVWMNLAGLAVRGVRFLSHEYLILGGALILVLALGSWIGARVLPASISVMESRKIDVAALFVGISILVAYAV